MSSTILIERAKAWLATLPDTNDCTYMGIPLEEFTKEELIKIAHQGWKLLATSRIR